MFKTKWNIVFAVVVCALLLPTTLIAKKQVERPFKVHGDVTVVISLLDGSLVGRETGEATHIGRYSSVGMGYLDAAGYGTENGVLTAANGDELSWTEAISPGNIERTFTGGTGRFENASGGFSTAITPDVVVDFPFLIVTFSYRATGTITY
jgi:hypothetical protein